MNEIDSLKIYLLYPYGFELSEKVKYDDDFIPYREITHTEHKGKVVKLTPEYANDIHVFGVGYIDFLPILEKELMNTFGKDVFFSRDVYFPNYKPDIKRIGEIGEKRVFSIDILEIPNEKMGEYIESIQDKIKKPKQIKQITTFEEKYNELNDRYRKEFGKNTATSECEELLDDLRAFERVFNIMKRK